jgi:hypothetical protein
MDLIWVRREEKYFFKWGWTPIAGESPSGKSAGLCAVACSLDVPLVGHDAWIRVLSS